MSAGGELPGPPSRPARGEKPRPAQPAVAVRIRRLPHAAGLPERASAGSAGWDLRAAIAEPVAIPPGTRRLIPTGLVLGLPPGYEAQIRPRSGLAFRQGLTVLNAPGTIDSDYRGEVKLLLVNLGDKPVEVERGERLAQMVVAAVPEVAFREDDALGRQPTEGGRNDGGFGSTGT